MLRTFQVTPGEFQDVVFNPSTLFDVIWQMCPITINCLTIFTQVGMYRKQEQYFPEIFTVFEITIRNASKYFLVLVLVPYF